MRTLRCRGSLLARPDEQLRLLSELRLVGGTGGEADFREEIAAHGWRELTPSLLEILQLNLGKLCNMSCRHCHVDAGPDRIDETMTRETVDACLRALDLAGAHSVDLTGGAPEMNPHFAFLVEQAVLRGKHVIDRCNLTVLLLPRFKDLPAWLAEHGVEVVCSLPHYRKRSTDAQRGEGAYEKSMEALRRLNAAGYGEGDPDRKLTVMTNPAGAFLAGNQAAMEPEWKEALEREQGVTFDHLIALNNMPCSRFLDWLVESSNLEGYMRRLVGTFNAETVAGLMCRNTISVSWEGKLYDCDFNQMLDMRIRLDDGGEPNIEDFDPERLSRRRIRTSRHCYGCTAGSGSSCGGAIAD